MVEKTPERWHLLEGPKPAHWTGGKEVAFLIRAASPEKALEYFRSMAVKRFVSGRGRLAHPFSGKNMHTVVPLPDAVAEIMSRHIGGARRVAAIRYVKINDRPDMLGEIRELLK